MFAKDIANPITYGLKKGDIKAAKIKTTSVGSTFEAKLQNSNLNLKTKLPGEFNIYNALAAAGVGIALDLPPKDIKKGIEAVGLVPGRMMRVKAGQPFEVIIDYAVTPSALGSALKSLRQTTKGLPAGRQGRVMIVFGATGDRDKAKRPVMGEIAAKNADKIFLTDDETYTEDPATIRRAVYAGIEKANGAKKCQEIPDRGEAIKRAISEARAGDSILITGLGHQKDRNMGGRLVAWGDEDAAKQVLKELA